ncbi:6-phosphogluconate phosphatase [Nymphon striatum]|nr:6-phosphogluconate phosphatase [Nymphon striatum]
MDSEIVAAAAEMEIYSEFGIRMEPKEFAQNICSRCICSNGPQNKMQKMLGRVGLHDKFRPYIFSAKDFNPPKHKPEPDIIFKALKEFEMQPQQAIVVEDSVHGIGAARAAGTRIVGFTGATHTYDTHADELIDAGAETVISRLSELPAIIDAFSSWDGIN